MKTLMIINAKQFSIRTVLMLWIFLTFGGFCTTALSDRCWCTFQEQRWMYTPAYCHCSTIDFPLICINWWISSERYLSKCKVCLQHRIDDSGINFRKSLRFDCFDDEIFMCTFNCKGTLDSEWTASIDIRYFDWSIEKIFIFVCCQAVAIFVFL